MRSDLIARYTIGEPVHENEFIVYPATDQRMGWSVFIVMPDIGLKADRIRFERTWTSINEAKSLPALRFVEILDLIAPAPGDDDFYIIEKRPTKTLRQYLQEQEMVAFDRASEVTGHILEGLATLHGAGYAHNALTDECIYVSETYSGLSVRIGNLHLISRIGEQIVPPYAPEFGAPDLYAGGNFFASAAADVYSMGMIAYKLFLSRQAYGEVFHSVMVWDDEHNREQSWKNIHVDPANVFPRLDTLLPGFPADLAGLVERMLSRDPSQRPRDGAEALADFRRATAGGRYVPQAMPGPLPKPPKPKRRWTAGKIVGLVVMLAVWAGVGIVAVPKLLGPDPELVASVEQWKAATMTRRAKAIEAKAPERASDDAARKAFDSGTSAMKAAEKAVEDKDYEAALAQYQGAMAGFGDALVDVARDDAGKAREAAKAAGGEAAPAFAEADKAMKVALSGLPAQDLRPVINGLKTARTSFDGLAADLTALSAAKRTATEKRGIAVRVGTEADPTFVKAMGAMAEAEAAAGKWDTKAAGTGFDTAAKGFDALIADVMAAKGPATTVKQKIATLRASIAKRAGAAEPGLVAAAPRITEADGRFAAEAYRLALAGYEPVLKDLEALSARGFCPASPDVAFQTVAAGTYPLDKVRLMTSSLGNLGSMLNVANGTAKIDKPFCMQAHAVTRGEMAIYYTTNSDPTGAEDYRTEPDKPASDVPWEIAEHYAAWLSGRIGTPVRLPSATEWMVSAAGKAPEPLPDTGDIVLQWSATSCEGGGYVAFLAQEGTTFAVCSDAATGGLFRIAAELR